jgi:hypothetical protein
MISKRKIPIKIYNTENLLLKNLIMNEYTCIKPTQSANELATTSGDSCGSRS